TAIALNGRWQSPPQLDYWAPSEHWYQAARARLDRAPAAFERLYDHDGFTVYAVHRAALAALHDGAAPRPEVRPWTAADRPRHVGAALPDVLSLAIGPRTAARGDTLDGVLEWHAPRPLPAGSYHVAVRFDRPLPAAAPA